MPIIRLGAATAWSRDRFGPGEDLVKRGELQYLCFECMSEVTMSEAQVRKIETPNIPGYDPYLEDRLNPVIKDNNPEHFRAGEQPCHREARHVAPEEDGAEAQVFR